MSQYTVTHHSYYGSVNYDNMQSHM